MSITRSSLQINLAKNIVFISMSMLFATLFMGYAFYRSSAEFWPPVGTQGVPLNIPSLSTFLIFLSSLFCFLIPGQIKKENFKHAHRYLNLTILFGLGFMITQSYLWNQMKSLGLIPSSGIFASIIYAFTWIHFAHMLIGLLGLVYLKKILAPETVDLLVKTQGIEQFWYFLKIIWLIIFFTLFIF